MKTSLLCGLSVALAMGQPFLGRFKVSSARKVLLMSGESGLATMQETIGRIARAEGIDAADIGKLILADAVPLFGQPDHLEAVGKLIVDSEVEVLIVDPCYLAMPGADAGNLFIQGQMLRAISQTCQREGVTLILCHHTTKGTGASFEPLDLSAIAWAGFAEFARQWLLVSRREPYVPGSGEHRLWLSAGGSAGHGGLWGVDISEGLRTDHGGRRWEVAVLDAAGVQRGVEDRKDQKTEERRQEALDRHKRKIVEALLKTPEGDTKSALRDRCGLKTSQFAPALAALLTDGDVEPCAITKGTQKRPLEAYRLVTKG